MTANGFQRFTVPVTLTVTAEAGPQPIKQRAATSAPWREPATPRPEPVRARVGRRPGLLAWLIAGGFLALAAGALVAVVAVICLTPPGGPPTAAPVARSPPPEDRRSRPQGRAEKAG